MYNISIGSILDATKLLRLKQVIQCQIMAIYAAQKVLIRARLNLRLKLVTMVMSDMALFFNVFNRLLLVTRGCPTLDEYIQCDAPYYCHCIYHNPCIFLQPSWRAKPASWAVLRLFWITCVYIYIYMFVRFGFPHYWLYTMLLTTHLPRGLRGLRTSNASWQTTVN